MLLFYFQCDSNSKYIDTCYGPLCNKLCVLNGRFIDLVCFSVPRVAQKTIPPRELTGNTCSCKRAHRHRDTADKKCFYQIIKTEWRFRIIFDGLEPRSWVESASYKRNYVIVCTSNGLRWNLNGFSGFQRQNITVNGRRI